MHAVESKASYTADAVASRIEFGGNQAAAEFKGVLHRFRALIDFAVDALSNSRLDVQIDLNSLDTKDKERD